MQQGCLYIFVDVHVWYISYMYELVVVRTLSGYKHKPASLTLHQPAHVQETLQATSSSCNV